MKNSMEEKTISSVQKHRGLIINVREDTVIFEDGSEHKREVATHPGGVVIAAFNNKNEILLIRQWRHPIQKKLIELPAGKLDYGEDPFVAAKRELEEETGFIANKWKKLGEIYSTPGFCDEKLHIYRADNLTKTQTNFDDGEYIETFCISFKEAINMIKLSKIQDAKTIAAIGMLNWNE
ncbi:MAG: NUDIX hydrolase [Candidatus Gastranaerophilales bacterium]|nr:NUDIX hydrolase [Candidatus Gastranaerophilales bacterium]